MSLRTSPQNSFILTWKIEKFSCLKTNKGKFFESPCFSETSSTAEKWTIRLYPKGFNSDAYLSFQLCRNRNMNSNEEYTKESTVDFVMSIIAKDGLTMLGDKMRSAKFTEQLSQSSVYGFVRRDELTSRESFFLPNDTLTIQCNVIRPAKQHIVAVRYQVEKLSFTWTILNFRRINNLHSEKYIVPLPCCKYPRLLLTFQLAGSTIPESYLVVVCEKIHEYSNNIRQFSTANTSLFRITPTCYPDCKHNYNFDYSSIIASFSISVSNMYGQKTHLVDYDHSFVSENATQRSFSPQLIKRSALLSQSTLYLIDDNLNLFFDINISNGKYITTKDSRTATTPTSPPQIKPNTLGRMLFLDKKFCDVTLKVGNKEFPVHKCVICSKSPIFNYMFTCDMQEKKSGIVDIGDISPDTLKHLLQYMYTDELDGGVLDEKAVAYLYSAAHMYEMPPLVEHFSSLLKSKITHGNVWDIASFASTYHDTVLIEAARCFISKRPKECLESERWHILLQSASSLLKKNEIIMEADVGKEELRNTAKDF